MLLFLAYGFTKQPTLSEDERGQLASHFEFERYELPVFSVPAHQFVRKVHPAVEHISAWISAVGAAVALGDVDGDGIANDACIVDPRIDMVMVAPIPRTGDRYGYFALDPFPLPYDRKVMAPMGCLLGDFNEDGRTDVLAYYWGRSPVAFLRTPGAGFTGPGLFKSVELVAGRPNWNTAVATQADVDGDGHVDVIIGNYFPDGAAVLDPHATDKWEMQDSFSRAFNGGINRVLRWTGATGGDDPTVTFEEVQPFSPEVAGGWSLAVAAGDLDGDLLPEIYFANDFGPDRLLHNRSKPGKIEMALIEGVKGMTTPSSKVVGRDSFKGMGVDFGDLNGDGYLDIYVSNIAHEFALQESHFAYLSTGQPEKMAEGIAPFVDHSEELGLARSFFSWEAKMADFDDDGVPEAMQATGFVKGDVDRWPELQELATGNDQRIKDPAVWPRFQPGDDISGHVHNPFFVRAASGRYYDLAEQVGLGEPMLSRGIAIGDVDRDGDLDFALANQFATSYVYFNESSRRGAFLGLRPLLPLAGEVVEGVRVVPPDADVAGRPAIGAQARVKLPDGRTLTAFVDGGNGHSGGRSPELFFGLGDVVANQPLDVELSWRDNQGVVQRSTLRTTPGWHTVVLGSATGKGE